MGNSPRGQSVLHWACGPDIAATTQIPIIYRNAQGALGLGAILVEAAEDAILYVQRQAKAVNLVPGAGRKYGSAQQLAPADNG